MDAEKRNAADPSFDLSIVLPCRNEAAAIGSCIEEIKCFLSENALNGEILVVDNASDDGSGSIAEALGARVVREDRPGYGSALKAGIMAAKAPVIIMGDCDTTYDFMQLGRFYGPLASGECDFIIGDRFAGGIEKGAMPLSHKIGVKVLSALARQRYKTDVRDFHCGLRGFTRAAADSMELKTDGMEFATEMIAEAAEKGLRIAQVPVSLRKCSLARSSKLRTIRDGFRHLRLMIAK